MQVITLLTTDVYPIVTVIGEARWMFPELAVTLTAGPAGCRIVALLLMALPAQANWPRERVVDSGGHADVGHTYCWGNRIDFYALCPQQC